MNQAQSRAERLYVLAAAAAGSLLLLLLGPYSNFNPPGYLDPWYYLGYFTNFEYLVRNYGPNYFVGRLPWILPGLGAFRVASPEVASVLLNAAILAVSAVALYWAVRWHYGVKAAALAAVALVTNPYFISAAGWDSADGPAIAYAFVALAFAVRPHGREEWNAVWTGVFLALSALTHLTGAPMLVTIPVLLLWRHRETPRQCVTLAVRMAVGGAVAVLALAPVSQVLVGRWTYFYWQIFNAMHVVSHASEFDLMWGRGPAFLLTSPRLFVPLLLAVAAPFLLRRARKPVAQAAWISLSLSVALFAIVEFVLGVPTLRVPYHGTFLIVPLFFVAGALLGEMDEVAPRWTLALAVLAVALPFMGNYLLRTLPVWPSLLVLTAAVFLVRGAARQAAVLALLFVAPCLDFSVSHMWDRPPGRNLTAMRQLMTLQDYLKANLAQDHRALFWVDREENEPLFASAEALYLFIHSDLTKDVASATDAQLREEIRPNMTLVHLTRDPGKVEGRVKALAARGFQVGNARHVTMPWGTAVLQDVK